MLYKYEEDYVEQEADYSIELLKTVSNIFPAPILSMKKKEHNFVNSGLKKEVLRQQLIR